MEKKDLSTHSWKENLSGKHIKNIENKSFGKDVSTCSITKKD